MVFFLIGGYILWYGIANIIVINHSQGVVETKPVSLVRTLAWQLLLLVLGGSVGLIAGYVLALQITVWWGVSALLYAGIMLLNIFMFYDFVKVYNTKKVGLEMLNQIDHIKTKYLLHLVLQIVGMAVGIYLGLFLPPEFILVGLAIMFTGVALHLNNLKKVIKTLPDKTEEDYAKQRQQFDEAEDIADIDIQDGIRRVTQKAKKAIKKSKEQSDKRNKINDPKELSPMQKLLQEQREQIAKEREGDTDVK